MIKLALAVLLTAIVAFPLGLVAGFALGIYSTDLGKEMLAVATSKEEFADVAQPKSIARDHFQLKYPGNWKLAENDEHFDIEQYFSIDTPGYAYVAFDIRQVDASPQDNVQDWVEYFNKLVRVSGRTSFDTWGKYSGVGVELVGDYVGEPCVVRIFSYTSEDLSFTVTEFYDTATKQHVRPGFDLVEATFELHPPEDGE